MSPRKPKSNSVFFHQVNARWGRNLVSTFKVGQNKRTRKAQLRLNPPAYITNYPRRRHARN